MTLDQILYAFVAIASPVIIYFILRALKLKGAAFYQVGVLLVAWLLFTTIVTLPRIGPLPGAAFSIFLPVIAFRIFYGRSDSAKTVLLNASIVTLIAVQSSRLAGGLFVALHNEGRLSDPFALIAGSGDMIAAAFAIPAAYIAWKQKYGWEFWVLTWNFVGFFDFIIAIFLGVTSQMGSPIQLFTQEPGVAALGQLPWRYIPNYFVPLFLMIHVSLFIRLVPEVRQKYFKTPIVKT